MQGEFTADWFGTARDPAEYDPVRAARGPSRRDLPKRFYGRAEIGPLDDRLALLLDGKPARTKLRRLISVPNAAVGDLLADEWNAQERVIDPATMPVTRILHATIDHVGAAMADIRDEIVRYAGSDAVCYRAETPAELVALQMRNWDRVLDHAASRYGARFMLSAGIRHVEQPAGSLAAIGSRIGEFVEPLALATLHVLTTISGSALIALAVADGLLDAKAGFAAGELDADYEVATWGADEEAAARRAARLADFTAATAILRALEA